MAVELCITSGTSGYAHYTMARGRYTVASIRGPAYSLGGPQAGVGAPSRGIDGLAESSEDPGEARCTIKSSVDLRASLQDLQLYARCTLGGARCTNLPGGPQPKLGVP